MKSRFLNQNLNRWHLLILALCLLAALRVFEHRSLYAPDLTDYPQNPLDAMTHHPLKASVQEVTITTADHLRLNAWFIPPKDRRPTVVFAHGNGGNIGDRYSMMVPFVQVGYGFLAFDYRGYGKSEGHPSEEGLYRDMEAASQYLAQVQHIPVTRQIAMGESLGSAVAIHSASKNAYRAVILFSSMTAAPAVAEHLQSTDRMGWLGILPLSWLMYTKMDSLSKIGQVQSPLLIIHGEEDTMMPLRMPHALYEKAISVPYKKLLIIPQAGHNDVFYQGRVEWMKALERLMNETKPVD
jgi:uncharacterized protein